MDGQTPLRTSWDFRCSHKQVLSIPTIAGFCIHSSSAFRSFGQLPPTRPRSRLLSPGTRQRRESLRANHAPSHASRDLRAKTRKTQLPFAAELAVGQKPRPPVNIPIQLKGEGNTVLSTTGEPGTLKGTNPSVTATSPLTLWGSACHALFSALEPKQ